jgi:hypothetical protein
MAGRQQGSRPSARSEPPPRGAELTPSSAVDALTEAPATGARRLHRQSGRAGSDSRSKRIDPSRGVSSSHSCAVETRAAAALHRDRRTARRCDDRDPRSVTPTGRLAHVHARALLACAMRSVSGSRKRATPPVWSLWPWVKAMKRVGAVVTASKLRLCVLPSNQRRVPNRRSADTRVSYPAVVAVLLRQMAFTNAVLAEVYRTPRSQTFARASPSAGRVAKEVPAQAR